MTIDIDAALGRLASEPAPPALDGIDGTVLARVHLAAPLPVRGIGIGAFAASAALIAGIAAGTPMGAAASPQVLSPFGPSTPLAPSTLLVGAE